MAPSRQTVCDTMSPRRVAHLHVFARILQLSLRAGVLAGWLCYLLTWNRRHLGHAAIRGKIEDACREAGMHPPIICTPEELTET